MLIKRIEDLDLSNMDVAEDHLWCTTTQGVVDTISNIIKGKRTVELMAGNGYLCGMLKRHLDNMGEDINLLTAYDEGDWCFFSSIWYYKNEPCVVTKENIDLSGADVFIMFSPPHTHHKGIKYLEQMKSGTMLIYCGSVYNPLHNSEFNEYLLSNMDKIPVDDPLVSKLYKDHASHNQWGVYIKQ